MVWSMQACFVIWKHGMFKTSQPTESGARLQRDPSCVEAEECPHGLSDSSPRTEARQSLCLFCKPCQDNCCKLRRWGRLLKRTCACGLGVPGKPGAAGPLGSQGSVSPGLTQVPVLHTWIHQYPLTHMHLESISYIPLLMCHKTPVLSTSLVYPVFLECLLFVGHWVKCF